MFSRAQTNKELIEEIMNFQNTCIYALEHLNISEALDVMTVLKHARKSLDVLAERLESGKED